MFYFQKKANDIGAKGPKVGDAGSKRGRGGFCHDIEKPKIVYQQYCYEKYKV